MILRIIAVGRLKERHWQDGCADYATRLGRYARLELIEVPEAHMPERGTGSQEERAVLDEGRHILEKLDRKKDGSIVIALDRTGRSSDSVELAGFIKKEMISGRRDIAWIIGGPAGLSGEVLARADHIISLSRLTFPHQMARLILLEQLYRCMRIINLEPYHR